MLVKILVLLKYCMFYLHSLDHKVFKLSATKKLLELLQIFDPMPKELVTTMKHKRALVLIQQDGYSCEWRVLVNAMRLVK